MKVFLSWSGDKSRMVAEALRDWLPSVIQEVEPFMSSKDIEPGARWPSEIARRLEDTKYGIVCVTRENQHASWLNFEAGALAKQVEESRVVPLAIDLKPSDIAPPLGHFNGQAASESGMGAIVRAVNAMCEQPLEESRLDATFSKWWPDLDAKIQEIEADTPAPTGETRDVRELVEETLDLVRGLTRSANESALWADRFQAIYQPVYTGQPIRSVFARPATFDPDAMERMRIRGLESRPTETTPDDPGEDPAVGV
ncbi:MAG: toll/interleukin-1 receptor domain-containing protein [Solirubrobacteraceae bacterium]